MFKIVRQNIDRRFPLSYSRDRTPKISSDITKKWSRLEVPEKKSLLNGIYTKSHIKILHIRRGTSIQVENLKETFRGQDKYFDNGICSQFHQHFIHADPKSAKIQ